MVPQNQNDQAILESAEGYFLQLARGGYLLQLNRVYPTQSIRIIQLLLADTTLTSLDLELNDLNDLGALAEALRTNTTLISLKLRVNNLGPEDVKALKEALRTNKTLSSLKLNYNNLGPDGAKALAEALCTNTTLTSLDLSNNNIRPDGAKALAEALCTNTTLTSLDLSCSTLDSEGAKALAETLCTNTTLTSLVLRVSYLGSEGAQALAEALNTNTILTALDLRYSNIGPDGAKALAAALCTNTTLTSLDLSNNNIGPDGAKALAEALCTNTTLTSLDLFSNNLDPEGAKALAKALAETLRTNTTLTSLDLNGNNIPAKILKEVEGLLARNRHELARNREELARNREELAKIKTDLQSIPEALRLIMADYTDSSPATRVERQAQQAKLEQQKNESAQKTVTRITVLLLNALINRIQEKITTMATGIVTDTDEQILKEFHTGLDDILKDAILIGYDFTDDDDRLIKARISTTFKTPRTQKTEAFVSKLEDILTRIKEGKEEYNIWNPTDKVLHFIHNFTNRLSQQNEINITEETNALNAKIQNILAYNHKTGFKHFRQSDEKSIRREIDRIKNEASLIKQAFQKADLDAKLSIMPGMGHGLLNADLYQPVISKIVEDINHTQ